MAAPIPAGLTGLQLGREGRHPIAGPGGISVNRSSAFFQAPDWAAALTLAAMGPVGFSVDATRAAKSRLAGVLALLLMLPARSAVPRC